MLMWCRIRVRDKQTSWSSGKQLMRGHGDIFQLTLPVANFFFLLIVVTESLPYNKEPLGSDMRVNSIYWKMVKEYTLVYSYRQRRIFYLQKQQSFWMD